MTDKPFQEVGRGGVARVVYRVTFIAGRYKYVDSAVTGMPQTAAALGGKRTFLIGRDDDGHVTAFCFEEDEAKHICLGLNLLDAFVTGDTDAQKAFLQQFERMKKQ